MNSRFFGIVAFASGLVLPAVALAQTAVYPVSSAPSDSSAIVSQLQRQQAMDEYKAKFWSQEPLTQQDYYVQVKLDRQLIAKISAGEPVSQAELHQALKRVDTPY
jgi:hypothetical protein